jgi:sugar diacid utilization regulator
MHRLRRTVAVQNHLVDLLASDKDAGDLVASVSALLEMPIVVFDRQGQPVACSGATDPDRLSKRLWRVFSHLRGRVGPLGVVEEGPDRFYFREVVALKRIERIIAAAPPRGQTSEFTEMSLSFLQSLLALELLRRRDELAVQHRVRQHLLREFLSGEVTSSDILQHLNDDGLTLDDPWRVSLCVVQQDGHAAMLSDARRAHEDEENLFDATASFLNRRRVPYLSMPQPRSIVVLLSLRNHSEAEVRELLNAYRSHLQEALFPRRVSIGCSAAVSGSSGGSNALQQAREACLAASQAVIGDVVLFEEMSGRFRLLDGQSETALRAIQARAIATLREYDASHGTYLLATLGALLECDRALQPTADLLFIHRNTLQKRLQRIEQLLNVDLTRLDDLVELYLGLKAAELLGYASPGEHTESEA